MEAILFGLLSGLLCVVGGWLSVVSLGHTPLAEKNIFNFFQPAIF
jgi:hypothetical protein